MPRIKISLPDSFVFRTEIPLRIGDINYGGHLGHDTYLPLVHEARVQFFDKLGYTEMDIGGYGILLSGVKIEYLNEGFYGDNLIINIGVENFHSYGFDLIYQLNSKKDNRELGRVLTAIVLFDYNVRKVARVPDQVLDKFRSLKKL